MSTPGRPAGSSDAAALAQAIDALRESEERYRSLFESIDEGFCIVEVLFDDAGAAIDYRFVEVNPAFESQTGLEQAVGRRMREFVPEHEAHWFEIYGHVAQTGESVRFEAEAKGLGRFYDVNAFRIGEPPQRHVAVLFKDVSERKQLEDRLRDYAEELAEANLRKDEFLASLAHELRNPLAPICHGLALLQLPDNPKPAGELLSIIQRQVDHMVRLVDDLLDVSRITRGVIELRVELVDLTEVVRRALETSRPQLEAGDRALLLDIPDERLMMHGDPARLIQVVANLLNNAAKYTEERGRIWLTLVREDAHARISVRDDGLGIPAPMLGRVFDMFVQLDAHADGLGVGLSLVRSLVEMHDGTVDLHSDGIGHGSEFVVRLPLITPSPSARAGDGPAARRG